MTIFEQKELILKIKAMPEEQKKALGAKLDEWTVSRIEAFNNRDFDVAGVSVSDLQYQHDNSIHMSDVFLYYYLLGMPLHVELWKDKYPNNDKEEPSRIYCEITVEGYNSNGRPFNIFTVVTKEEYETLYKDIVKG